jgi:hypothetical protein
VDLRPHVVDQQAQALLGIGAEHMPGKRGVQGHRGVGVQPLGNLLGSPAAVNTPTRSSLIRGFQGDQRRVTPEGVDHANAESDPLGMGGKRGTTEVAEWP